MYKGKCTPFRHARPDGDARPRAPASTDPPQTITYSTLRSVHGPVFAFAHRRRQAGRARRRPKRVDFHELDAAWPFMRLAENTPTDAQSFHRDDARLPGHRELVLRRRQPHRVSAERPVPAPREGHERRPADLGQRPRRLAGLQPGDLRYKRLPDSANPQPVDPRGATSSPGTTRRRRGWRMAAGDVGQRPGPPRALLLHGLPRRRHGRGKPVDLASAQPPVTARRDRRPARPTDYPWMRRVIGSRPRRARRPLLALLDAWVQGGSAAARPRRRQRRTTTAPPSCSMDAWWPLAVRGEFQPGLGARLLDFASREFNPIQPDGIATAAATASSTASRWTSRRTCARCWAAHVRGRFSRIYCGGGIRDTLPGDARARRSLAAAAKLSAKYGASTDAWKLPVTCPVTTPASCDQIVPDQRRGDLDPASPFDNRGTFYQAVAVSGKRSR